MCCVRVVGLLGVVGCLRVGFFIGFGILKLSEVSVLGVVEDL